jgi:hypothetical protein
MEPFDFTVTESILNGAWTLNHEPLFELLKPPNKELDGPT